MNKYFLAIIVLMANTFAESGEFAESALPDEVVHQKLKEAEMEKLLQKSNIKEDSDALLKEYTRAASELLKQKDL